jgi:hypothetical protein
MEERTIRGFAVKLCAAYEREVGLKWEAARRRQPRGIVGKGGMLAGAALIVVERAEWAGIIPEEDLEGAFH